MEIEGTIAEFDRMDGLGWIDLANGERIRFGGTACKGFVPRIGLRVAVLETTRGYGGVTKAAGLRSLEAKPPAPAVPQPPAPRPRASLARVDAYSIPIDPQLRRVLARWDSDDTFSSDLEALMFEVDPMLSEELDCNDPWFFVIAMDGAGNAYGLYLHPDAPRENGPPWVFWDHEVTAVHYLASSTEELFGGVLRDAASWRDDRAPIERARKVFADLGISCPAEGPELVEARASWLPPPDDGLLTVDEYLATLPTDPRIAELGLLAHASHHRDARARARLDALYDQRGWSVPGKRSE